MKCYISSCFLLCIVGCGEPPEDTAAETTKAAMPSNQFVDVTAGSGLEDSFMQSGEMPSTRIVEVKGGGLAVIDVDNDGDLDLFMPNGATLKTPFQGPGARLYENLAERGEGVRFQDVTAGSGLESHRDWSFGVAVGDVNQDGRDDMVVSTLGANRLYLNTEDDGFVDASEAWGLSEEKAWSTSIGLGDLDGDGDLDLYVVNYLDVDLESEAPVSNFKGIKVLAGPRGMSPTSDRIYENVDGRFIDRSEYILSELPNRYGLNLAIMDFNNDGRLDVYVGNDSQANTLLRNDGEFTFTDVGVRSGSATNLEGDAQATMGIAIADVDDNGYPDIYSSNFSNDTNTLHTNLDGRFFDDRTNRFGLLEGTRPMLGWAAEFGDYDHDGDEDLVLFNGHVYPQATPLTMDSAYEQPPAYWERVQDRFRLQENSGLGGPRRDRTAVVFDADLDGDLDIIAGELNGPLRVYRNSTDNDRSVLIRPRPALGTSVELECIADDGTPLILRRWIRGGGPFQSTASPEAHFGLPLGAVPKNVRVLWPDGVTRTFDIASGTRRVDAPHQAVSE